MTRGREGTGPGLAELAASAPEGRAFVQMQPFSFDAIHYQNQDKPRAAEMMMTMSANMNAIMHQRQTWYMR